MAGVTEGISLEELGLAARNHGMPLEALRYDVTPLGLHYLLIHYDVPLVDPSTFRLAVGGRVARSLSLSLDDLRRRPVVTRRVTMECAGNGRARLEPRPVSQPWLSEAVGTAEWTGTPLAPLLEQAGLADDVVDIVFTGLDAGVEDGIAQRYARSLAVEEATREEVLLAYAVNGVPLPPQHGAPLRVIVPGWYGMANVKWLGEVTAVSEPFTGPQQVSSYVMRARPEDDGIPLTRMRPRALMVPPGVPEFLSRHRFVDPGSTRIEGRAWSGFAPIARVEVSTDGGASWSAAELARPDPPEAWTAWAFAWDAEPGEHELRVRATDDAGNAQPDEPEWNVGGYANNAVQRVTVTVRP